MFSHVRLRLDHVVHSGEHIADRDALQRKAVALVREFGFEVFVVARVIWKNDVAWYLCALSV
jgi:hypothetical protein